MASSRRFMLAIVPLCSILFLWVWMLLSVGVGGRIGWNLAKDGPDYISAAAVLHSGHNPYQWTSVWEGKRALLNLPENTPGKELARVAEPPVIFWAMEPLVGMPLGPACLILEAIFLISGIVGLWALLAAFNVRGRPIWVLIGLALPPMSYYIDIANLGVLVFAACSLGFLLARRYPLLAGLLLSLAICKPQLALPLAGLVILFHSAARRRSLIGFALGAVGILGASALTAGPLSLLWWLHAFHSFTDTLSIQTLFASLNVLYEPYLPARDSMIIAATLVVVAGIATLLALRRYWNERPVSVLQIAWLWVLWFAVAPYDHYYDYVFLTPVVLALVTGARGGVTRALVILYAVTLSGLIQLAAPQHIVAPCLLLVVTVAALLPWPIRRAPVRDRAATARSYQTTV